MKDSTLNSCRLILIIFSVIFMFGGVAIAFVGVWVAVDERTFHLTVVSITALIQHAAYVAIVVGSCIIIISFCGCFGAATASKCLLGVFVNFVLGTFVCECAGLVLVFVFRSTLIKVLRLSAINTIAGYGVVSAITVSWDAIQHEAECCGFNSGNDYQNTPYDVASKKPQPWPPSCCVLKPAADGKGYISTKACQENDIISAVFTNAGTGCYDAIMSIIREYSLLITIVVSAVMVTQLVLVFIACAIMRGIDESEQQPRI